VLAVIGDQQGHPAHRGGGLPAGLDLVDHFAQLQWRRGAGQSGRGHGAQVEGRIERPTDTFGGFGDAADAGLRIGRKPLSGQLIGKRQDAIHLLTDVGGYAIEEELGQRHGRSGLPDQKRHHGLERLREG